MINKATDIFAGVIFGGTNELKGERVNLNIVVWKVSISFLFNNKTGQLIGGTIGGGPGIGFGASVSLSNTGAFTQRNIT